jgi:hypothetical protein
VLINGVAAAVAWLLLVGLLAGCNPDRLDSGGDCSIRIGFQGTVYRSHNELNQAAPPGEPLGKGDLLDCDGGTIGHESVLAVKGVDPKVAVLVRARGHGIYVAEGVPRAAWPAPLRPR